MKIRARYAGIYSFLLTSVMLSSGVRADNAPVAPAAAPAPVAATTAATDVNSAPKGGIEVLQLVLAKSVQDHQPQDEITSAKVNDVVVGWCQIRSGLGEVKIHQRWLLNDKTMADVELPIKSSPYRTWSRKTLGDAGAWKLQVANDAGEVLKEISFTVTQ